MDARCNAAELLSKIRETDFAIVETALYLDAYPESEEALAYYRQLREKNDVLRAEYESTVGPLTIYSNECDNGWQWVCAPWPWEYESN